MDAFEVNFDGLIGPTHNYGGLSDGNLASAKNAGDVAYPKEAALQGLEKMRLLLRAGLKQGFLPPLMRPNLVFLQQAGFSGTAEEIIRDAAKQAPSLLKASYSASSMWAANAATVSPSADTSDKKLHLSVANLSTMLHRSLEAPDTLANLQSIFRDPSHFEVHPALPQHSDFSDEGAANHVRLSDTHGAPGVELFVYGRDQGEEVAGFPARQTRLASERIAASHRLDQARTVFARQSVQAIRAGAFHNDVVCVGSLNTLFTHELAFEDAEQTYADLRSAAGDLFDLNIVEVPNSAVPIEDAISSYLFNSQLLNWPGEDRLVLLAPLETKETPTTKAYCDALERSNGPIGRVEYVDVRQSMRNGGGPACLRLRVVMTEAEIDAVNPAYLLTEQKIDLLQQWAKEHYRDELTAAEFADPSFFLEVRGAYLALTGLVREFAFMG
ncbi:MAG: succinylarginine dihydrolase [Ponticaulis sp.]|nr:succinylarginine dihydrolase [Ponticaulis sp.]|tara:strand:- start:44242 stop:45564 length:1323 start_codon:yes stop_codon:yes gene_type:complete